MISVEGFTVEERLRMIEIYLVIACAWSCHPFLDFSERMKFSENLSSLCSKIGVRIPREGTIYDYLFEDGNWVPWEGIPEYFFPTKFKYEYFF
jgi:hypothetical protein